MAEVEFGMTGLSSSYGGPFSSPFLEGASGLSWCTSIRFLQVVVARLGRSLTMMAGFSNEHNSSYQPCCCMSFFLGLHTFTFIHV